MLKNILYLFCTAIHKVMPEQLERHRVSVQTADQLRRELQNDDNRESVRRDGGPTSDSDDDANEENRDSAPAPGSEKQKRIVAPRRKFEWTSETR